MEFESAKSFSYIGFVAILSAGLFALQYGVEKNLVLLSILGLQGVFFYSASKLSGGSDGEVVLRGVQVLGRDLSVVLSLLPIGLSSFFVGMEVLNIGSPYSLFEFLSISVAGFGLVYVALLAARPYGVKAENVFG